MGGFNPLLGPPALLHGPVLQPLPPETHQSIGERRDYFTPHLTGAPQHLKSVIPRTLFQKGDHLSQPNPASLPKIWNRGVRVLSPCCGNLP